MLVAAAQAGDRAALERLLRNHYDRIHRLCRRITGSDADAQDATQEAMLAVVRGLGQFDGRSAFSTWVYRVTTNACLDELRRRRRRPLPIDDEDGDRAEPAPAAPDDTIADHLRLDAALRSLPEDFRIPVVLRDVCDLDYAEIASVLGIPGGTVRSRIARGRGLLARALGNPTAIDDRPSPQP